MLLIVAVLASDEQKKTGNGTAEVVKLTVKRARPKATSPNRQGPQQCQVGIVVYCIRSSSSGECYTLTLVYVLGIN